MTIKVNGDDQQLISEVSVSDLLKHNDVKMPEMVSVQLNGKFVKREQFENTVIHDADEVDFLYFMGGGIGVIALSSGIYHFCEIFTG